MTGAVKAAGHRCLRDAPGRFSEQKLRSLHHSVFERVLHGRHPKVPPETAQAFPLSEGRRPGNVRQADILLIMMMDKFKHLLHAEIILIQPRPGSRSVSRSASCFPVPAGFRELPTEKQTDLRYIFPNRKLKARNVTSQRFKRSGKAPDLFLSGLAIQIISVKRRMIDERQNVFYREGRFLLARHQLRMVNQRLQLAFRRR